MFRFQSQPLSEDEWKVILTYADSLLQGKSRPEAIALARKSIRPALDCAARLMEILKDPKVDLEAVRPCLEELQDLNIGQYRNLAPDLFYRVSDGSYRLLKSLETGKFGLDPDTGVYGIELTGVIGFRSPSELQFAQLVARLYILSKVLKGDQSIEGAADLMQEILDANNKTDVLKAFAPAATGILSDDDLMLLDPKNLPSELKAVTLREILKVKDPNLDIKSAWKRDKLVREIQRVINEQRDKERLQRAKEAQEAMERERQSQTAQKEAEERQRRLEQEEATRRAEAENQRLREEEAERQRILEEERKAAEAEAQRLREEKEKEAEEKPITAERRKFYLELDEKRVGELKIYNQMKQDLLQLDKDAKIPKSAIELLRLLKQKLAYEDQRRRDEEEKEAERQRRIEEERLKREDERKAAAEAQKEEEEPKAALSAERRKFYLELDEKRVGELKIYNQMKQDLLQLDKDAKIPKSAIELLRALKKKLGGAGSEAQRQRDEEEAAEKESEATKTEPTQVLSAERRKFYLEFPEEKIKELKIEDLKADLRKVAPKFVILATMSKLVLLAELKKMLGGAGSYSEASDERAQKVLPPPPPPEKKKEDEDETTMEEERTPTLKDISEAEAIRKRIRLNKQQVLQDLAELDKLGRAGDAEKAAILLEQEKNPLQQQNWWDNFESQGKDNKELLERQLERLEAKDILRPNIDFFSNVLTAELLKDVIVGKLGVQRGPKNIMIGGIKKARKKIYPSAEESSIIIASRLEVIEQSPLYLNEDGSYDMDTISEELLDPLYSSLEDHWQTISSNGSWRPIFNRMRLNPEEFSSIQVPENWNRDQKTRYLHCLSNIAQVFHHMENVEEVPQELYDRCMAEWPNAAI